MMRSGPEQRHEHIDPRVLIVDQLEELFFASTTDRWSELEVFFGQLGERCDATRSCRSFSACARIHRSARPVRRTYSRQAACSLPIAGNNKDAAKKAICGPAAQAGRPFAPGVSEKLVDDLRSVRIQQPDGTYRVTRVTTSSPYSCKWSATVFGKKWRTVRST